MANENSKKTDSYEILVNLRSAIQEAEKLGMVRTESGKVITGAILEDDEIVLV